MHVDVFSGHFDDIIECNVCNYRCSYHISSKLVQASESACKQLLIQVLMHSLFVYVRYIQYELLFFKSAAVDVQLATSRSRL